ncbi:DUF6896 domain-containing protein [Ectopseudomonas alcaliphila]|uniref:DUF6896 domain-containing protein n=1 Tax=Ectopseudomonas alcaliphila TaxID=101564 RepID=A0ABU4Q4L8_9GAMM|nr:hypothetical protein [Pseudomonas alcaliphila]MDX5995107.1 hypothetical protein [Pseudomonas alcaliphila]
MDNLDKVRKLIPLWYAHRKWAEKLLVRVFDLKSAEEILKPEHRGNNPIPGTNWMYRTHGVGVDIYRTADVGGIDFDFNKTDPDEWRLQVFFEKQYNEGNLPFAEYRELYEDEGLLQCFIKMALEGGTL